MQNEQVLHGKDRIAKNYVGQNVKVFLMNGAVISGKMADASNEDALIIDEKRNKEATITFDHVISITRY